MNLKLIKDFRNELKAGDDISSLGQVQKQMLFELGYAVIDTQPQPKKKTNKKVTNEEDKV